MSSRYSLVDENVLYLFNQILPERARFLNCTYIHPLKQRQLAEAVEKAKSYPNVAYLVVFGSTLTERCEEESDIDLVVWDDTHSYRPPNNDAYDLFYADELNPDCIVYDDVCERGVIIYARDNAGDCHVRFNGG